MTFSETLAGAVAQAGGAVVSVHARPRVPCSGVLWREGLVVSCDHTVRREEEITISLPDGGRMPATLVGRDQGTDLALLRLAEGAPLHARVAASTSLRVGHLVLALGRTDERGVTASLGMVSAFGGPWRTWRGGEVENYIRLDLSIQLGFSGGPLVDAAGEIVGINTSALARGAGMTIPAATVNRVIDAILSRGSVGRGYVGLTLHPVLLPESLRERLGLEMESGVIILSVEPRGPAGQGGLMMGDVLVRINEHPITDTPDLQSLLGPESVGRELKATFIRAGELAEAAITIGERPRRGR